MKQNKATPILLYQILSIWKGNERNYFIFSIISSASIVFRCHFNHCLCYVIMNSIQIEEFGITTEQHVVVGTQKKK